MKAPIYMDNHATTPIDPRVLEAMMPYLTTAFGNAASRNHLYGWEAEAAVDEARDRVAALLGATSAEIVFTSGATESNNLAIIGAARHYREKGNHVVTCATEHKAVLDSCRELEREGFEVTVLAPDSTGQVSPDQVAGALTARTVLVTLMLANNEIGTVHRLRAIAAICRARGVLIHSDAVQGVGKIPFDVADFGIDLASITAHKIYGPKGCGALYVRGKDPRVRLSPLIHGGGHERGLRSGTLNVPGIVGLGKACELAASELPEESKRLRRLRNRLYEGITSQIGDVHLNGYPLPEIDAEGNLRGEEWRLPGNLNISFGDVEGEALIAGIRDVAVSSGAACTSASIEPSHVQKAIGVSDALAYSAIRFGLGRFNTQDEIDYTVGEVVRSVRDLRAQRPASQETGAS
jgi:cysteine desulfurase